MFPQEDGKISRSCKKNNHDILKERKGFNSIYLWLSYLSVICRKLLILKICLVFTFCNWITCPLEMRTYLCKVFCRLNVGEETVKVSIFGFVRDLTKTIKIKVHQCFFFFFYESKKAIHQFGAGTSHIKNNIRVHLDFEHSLCSNTVQNYTNLYLRLNLGWKDKRNCR